MKKFALHLTAGLVLLSGAAAASTSDIASHRRVDFYAPGTHVFYMWCADGEDRMVLQHGRSALEAATRLNDRAESCHLSWQGRIPS